MDAISYNIETVNGQEVIWYEKDGVRVSFPSDNSNSDYSAYLESLNDDTETE